MEKLNEFIQGESFPVGILPEAESFQFNEVREELVISSSSMDVRSLSQFKSSDLLLKSLVKYGSETIGVVMFRLNPGRDILRLYFRLYLNGNLNPRKLELFQSDFPVYK